MHGDSRLMGESDQEQSCPLPQRWVEGEKHIFKSSFIRSVNLNLQADICSTLEPPTSTSTKPRSFPQTPGHTRIYCERTWFVEFNWLCQPSLTNQRWFTKKTPQSSRHHNRPHLSSVATLSRSLWACAFRHADNCRRASSSEKFEV